MFFPELSPESKVWVYAADRDLSATEVNYIQDCLNQFIPEWAAHGASLYGNGTIYKNRFVLLAVDESQVSASGCSIDTSVHFIKKLGVELGADFMNRVNMVIEENGELATAHVSDLKNYPSAKVYNPMITRLRELNSSWLIPVSESPFV